MGRASSGDLRVRVSKASQAGLSARGAAARFGVAPSTAIRWISRAKAGEVEPRPTGRRRGSSLDGHEGFIVGLIETDKAITLAETEPAMDVKTLHAKIGELSLETGFLSAALGKAGLLARAKRRSSATTD